MSQVRKNILERPRVSLPWALVAATIWLAILVPISTSPLGRYLDERIGQPIDFRVRDILGAGPQASPRLKILVVDDNTLAQFDEWPIAIEHWAVLLHAIDARKPRAIFIDQMWSKIFDPNGLQMDSLELLAKRSTPITIGGVAARKPVVNRDRIILDRLDYSLAAHLDDNLRSAEGGEIHDLGLPSFGVGTFTGPAAGMDAAFDHVGHIMYDAGGRVAPVFQFDFATIIPHAFLFVANSWKISRRAVTIDGYKVNLDSDGMIPINFLRASDLYERRTILSMRYFFNRSRIGQPLDEISAGDTVVILPAFFTGNTDFRWTPYGHLPAGLIPSALINSALTKQWIQPVGFERELTIVAVFIGMLLGMVSGPLSFWPGFGAALVTGFLATTAAFSVGQLQLSWIVPGIGFAGMALTIYGKRARAAELKTRALRQALEGMVPDGELQLILKNQDRIPMEATEVIVTLMFIDIVGFSLVSENLVPRFAFEALKGVLDSITHIIHRYGGRIDKTLGDGLLCYFGYSIEGKSSAEEHARAAIQAAIDVQKENIARLSRDRGSNRPLMPLRIGVNTSSCYYGNLGSGDRIDFTVIGNGVNFTKRLEGGCQSNRILVSRSTYDLVKNLAVVQGKSSRRDIRIKHHDAPFEAFDIDPLPDDSPHRPFVGELGSLGKGLNNRMAERTVVGEQADIGVQCSKGMGRLRDFSVTGINVVWPIELAKSELVDLSFSTPDGLLDSELAEIGLNSLSGEVRWIFSDSRGFIHGISLNRVSVQDRQRLYEALVRRLSRYGRGEVA